MTQNPFGEGANPFGSLDLGAMLEQAQQMQSQLMAAQEELAAQLVSGNAGGVSVTLSGTGELTAVQLLPGHFDGNDEESLTDLADLFVAAYRDAKSKVDALTSATLGPLSELGGSLGGSLGGGPGLDG